jgi:hypothetical protein
MVKKLPVYYVTKKFPVIKVINSGGKIKCDICALNSDGQAIFLCIRVKKEQKLLIIPHFKCDYL